MEDKHRTHAVRERIGMIVWPTDPGNFVATLVRLEDAGVQQIWAPAGPPWSSDLLTALAAAAMRTRDLKLGTAIVQAPSRHPVFLAQQTLSLSKLAPGRLTLGIGTGRPDLARQLYGVEMGKPLTYLREYVQVLRPLLQQGEVHHHGHHFSTDASLHASAQVPVYIAALGTAAFRLAGEVADGVLPFLCPVPYLLSKALPALNRGAAAAGRARPTLVAHVPVALAEERAKALQAGRQAMRVYTTYPFYRNMFMAAGFSTQEIDAVADTLIENLLVFGDEGRIRDRLQALLAAGIDELALGLVPVADPIQEGARLARLIGQL